MSDEIALTTDSSSESPCVLCWDTASWMQLKAYKHGVCPRKCLTLLSQSYIFAAQTNKPFFYVWDISKEQMQSKITCPANITALAVSPNGLYCAVASSGTIYIWHVGTGNQLCTLSRHFQPITCLNFTDDSSYLISGADDNLVSVWSLVSVLSRSRGLEVESVKPKYTWSNHSLPITSVHVGPGGKYATVATSSLDQTCKLWDLSTGHFLRSFTFDTAILSVVMDAAEYRLFAGGFNGNIYVVHLFSQTLERENSGEHIGTQCFVGHSMIVTSLSLSMDGSTLLSGSKDCTARVWDVSSRQCLKVLEHKGSVENVQIYPRFQNFDIKRSKASLPVIGTFKRSLHDLKSQENESVPIGLSNKNAPVDNSAAYFSADGIYPDKIKNSHGNQAVKNDLLDYVLRENCESTALCGGEKEMGKSELREQLEESKHLNQTLYKFAVEELLHEIQEHGNINMPET